MLLKKGRSQAVLIDNIRQLVEGVEYGDWLGGSRRPKMKKARDIAANGAHRVQSRARTRNK